MKLQIHFSCDLNIPSAVPALLQIEAAHLPHTLQTVQDAVITIEPYAEAKLFTDLYGNSCRRLLLPERNVNIDYKATVIQPEGRLPLLKPVEEDLLQLPTEILIYLLPSRYCQSDRLVNMALDLFGHGTPGFARVQDICNWINEHVEYKYGTSDSHTSAFETATERIGVCRDFAHLAITFCRTLNIPARYVSGYCLGLDPPDFHAYFEAYLDGRWVAFDATERQPRPALIPASVGRDAADCAWSTFFGNGEVLQMSVDVQEAAAPPQ